MTTNAKILIIDDNAPFRETLRGLIHIAHPSWSIEEAADGAEGVRLAQASSPDLIFLDLYMPLMNGDEAAEQLRSHPNTRATPVVLMTSEDRDDPFVNRLAVRCQGFLSKPISFREIERTFERLLKNKTVTRLVRAPITMKIDPQIAQIAQI
jgi:two-component system sensor histidine kinase ChiS